ncbi:hypothetical protein [Streptomyces sp. MMS24-I29]|uniref:hypothetical protein n=1 Tax=Streptomyces sp. MMS24-I29 TaxID=3351480 RepID=UPI003C7E7956
MGEAAHCIDAVFHTTKRQRADIGHLTAGDNDDDSLLLVTKCIRIELSPYEHVTADTGIEAVERWNYQLAVAVQALGYSDRDVPAPEGSPLPATLSAPVLHLIFLNL